MRCSACGRESPDDARFCAGCGAPLALQPPRHEVRKTVTVLFSDVVSLTALGERLDPESLRRVMSRYFDEMRAVLERHGGAVEKFVGDAVMAVFGIPLVHEDDALRAVRAAAEMREALGPLNEQLLRERGVGIETRTGINTGEVVAGSPASGTLVTGDAVNASKRLEEAAGAGEILLGQRTYQLVRDAVRVEATPPLVVKGKVEPLQAHRLIEVAAGAPGVMRRLDSPLVGREQERKLLGGAFERMVHERACHLFTLLGAAGVGKSRLVEEFLGSVGDRATVGLGRCLPYGDGITFWPLAEALRQLVGEDVHAAALDVIGPGRETELIAKRIEGAVGAAEPSGTPEETFWSVRKLFEAAAARRPLVCVFDDVNWAEGTFLDLVEHIADWSRDAPILILCVARPELLDLRPDWSGGKLNATTVLLEPLDEMEAERLVGNLLGTTELSEHVRQTILETAEGNPLFVEETLGMLIDDGLLERGNGGWAATADLSSLRVPPTIQALLAARLDRLAVDERAVIERAAVEGKVFHRGAVAALAPDPLRARVGEQLLALVRKELIRPERTSFAGDDAFRFRHILIRDAAYDALPKELRAELHERFADWLEKQAGDRAGEYEEILGYHLEQAWRYRGELGPLDEHGQAVAERAGERLAAAGKRAFTRGDMQAASSLLARAAELLPREGAQHMSVLVALGAALEATGELTRATVVLDEAVELALRTGDTRIELRARLERAALALVMSGEREQPHSEAAELAEQAIPVFEAAQDHEGLARAWEMIGNRHWSACHYGARAEALERALVHAERAGDRRLEAEIYQGLGLSIGSGPAPLSEAIDRCEQLLARAHGHPALEAAVRGPLAVLYAGRGRFDEARRAYRSSLETFRELGLKLRIGLATIFGGRLEMLAGDPIAAERELRVGYELLRESGEKNVFSTLTGQLAEVMCAQGRYQDAARLVQEAREASSPDDVISEILWRRTEATLKARGGEYETAERLARKAVDLSRGTDSIATQAGSLRALAEVLRSIGRGEEAAENLREALRLFEQKENTVAAAEAKNLLAEIAVESAISRKPR